MLWNTPVAFPDDFLPPFAPPCALLRVLHMTGEDCCLHGCRMGCRWWARWLQRWPQQVGKHLVPDSVPEVGAQCVQGAGATAFSRTDVLPRAALVPAKCWQPWEPAEVWYDGARNQRTPITNDSKVSLPADGRISQWPVTCWAHVRWRTGVGQDATNRALLPSWYRCASQESPRAQAPTFPPAVPFLTHHRRVLGDRAAVAHDTHRLAHSLPPSSSCTCAGHETAPLPTCLPVLRAVCLPVLHSGEYGACSSYSHVVLRMRKFIAKIGNLALPQGKREGNYCFIPRVVFVKAALGKGWVMQPSTYSAALKSWCVGIFFAVIISILMLPCKGLGAPLCK